jgi:maltooligosyltrehalose trehalohydrolase
VAEGRTREFSSFGWQGAVPNPQDPASFERSKLDWRELAQPAHAELLEWYRALIRLRRAKPALPARAAGREKAAVKFDAAAGWLTFAHGGVLCVFNFAAAAQRVPLPGGGWELALASDGRQATSADEVPARGTLIFAPGGV